MIGTSWAALFLARGLQITISDPLPDVEARVRAGLQEIAPTLEQLGLPVAVLEQPSPALRFEADVWPQPSTTPTSCRRTRPSGST